MGVDIEVLEKQMRRTEKQIETKEKRTSMSTGKKTSTKVAMLNEVEDWYQYIPVFKKHIKRGKKVPGTVRKPTSNIIRLLKSPFPKRPDTLFLNYPAYVEEDKFGLDFEDRIQTLTQEQMINCPMIFRINDNCNIYNSLVNSCKNAGMILVDEGYDWNLLWSNYTSPEILRDMDKFQKLNHFPSSYQMGRKDCIWKNVHRMIKKHGDDFDILPKTYIFPQDAHQFNQDKMLKENAKTLWILKPSASSCGKGIKVMTSKDKLPRDRKGFVISKYLSKPHLIDGYKYDLRIYVLVTSYDPLVIYMYEEGLCRFATEKYSLKVKDLKKRYVHLTNYSINKKAENYVQNEDGTDQIGDEEDAKPSKWSLKQLKEHIIETGYDWEQVQSEIRDVIIKTIISIEPHVVNGLNNYARGRYQNFELYGFDVMLDSSLKPWIIEVNVSPSLSSSSPFDKSVKSKLICDALTTVGFQPYNRSVAQKETEKEIASRLRGGLKSDKKQKDEDLDMLAHFVEEDYRSGSFNRIFPLDYNISYYAEFLEPVRYRNDLLWTHIEKGTLVRTLEKAFGKVPANTRTC